MAELIPAIDLRQGRVVRLEQGDDARRKSYDMDPEALLDHFATLGVERVHLVDLDAAFGEKPQLALIERLVASTRLRIELGGGLRHAEAVAWALGAGCERVVLGSLVARDFPAFAALAEQNPGRLVPAVEVKNGELAIAGWQEKGVYRLEELCGRLRGQPCPALLCTDVARDGTLAGPNLELAAKVAALTGLGVLVSGGVGSLGDIAAAARTPGVDGVIVGKAFYDGRLDLAAALRSAGERTGLKSRVIPCLDVKEGRVVKGVRFQGLRELGDPAEFAERYAAEGADELVFLDIGAAPEGRDTDLDWVRRTAERVFVPLTVGGGVRSLGDAERLLRAGADKVGVNSAALARPELIGEIAVRFGRQCVVLSVDARRRPEGGWEALSHGGRRPTGKDALAWLAEGAERGAGEILLTSVDRDGTLEGYDLELLRAAAARVAVPIVASGGAGEVAHFAAGLRAGAAAVLAASIFHDGRFTVGALKDALAARGLPIRREVPS